ncbi:MAG: RluA family pseudouridine synthase [Candidatus Gastranaerophilaceae bacterium]
MQKKTIYIENSNQNQRLDSYLTSVCELSRSHITQLIKNGEIVVNGKKVKPAYNVCLNDCIEIFAQDNEETPINPEDIPIDIRYEDNNMLVINKPKNMLTHPTTKEKSKTLVNALLNKFGYEGLSSTNGIMRPGIVHRLDRNTSGLLMVAKNDMAHQWLAEQIKTKKAVRKYLAVVSGTFENDEGTIDAAIARHPSKCEKFTVSEDGKPSVTHYKVLERFKHYTLIELTLETGRTHQIRVHMSYIGHPIVNDSLYGGEKIKVKTIEQVLQAYKLSFFPPLQQSRVDIELYPDDDMVRVLNKLRSEK